MKSSHFDILLSMSLKGISTKRRKKERWAVQYKNEKRLQSSNNTNDNILNCEQIINH